MGSIKHEIVQEHNMDNIENIYDEASDNPTILDQLAKEHSNDPLGYPEGLVTVGQCGDRGWGLVAAKAIKKGDLVYEEAAGIEVELTEVQVKAHLAVKCEE